MGERQHRWRLLGPVTALAIGLFPAAARAAFPWPPLPTVTDPAWRMAWCAVGLWASGWLAVACYFLWRSIRARNRRQVWLFFAMLFWATLPVLAAWQLSDRDLLADKWPSLRIAVWWLLLALPALRLPGKTRHRMIAKWVFLLAADLLGIGLVLWRLRTEATALSIEPLLLFILTLHAGVLTDLTAGDLRRTFPRWLGLLLALFAFAAWFVPPAVLAGRANLLAGPVRLTPRLQEPLRWARFADDGLSAFVLPQNQPRELWQIRLADGEKTVLYRSPDLPIQLAAQNSERTSLALATQPAEGHLETVRLYNTAGFTPIVALNGNNDFRLQAMAITSRHLLLAGAGDPYNLFLCAPLFPNDPLSPKSISQCNKRILPWSRTSRAEILPSFSLALLTESDTRWRDGGRMLSIHLATGDLRRLTDFDTRLGGMDYDRQNASIFLAQPALDRMQTFDGLTLSLDRSFPLESGVEHLQIDWRRGLLLAASPRTGSLAVYRLRDVRLLARAAIGPGIRSLDYHGPSATALLAGARGLVFVRILELPGVLVND